MTNATLGYQVLQLRKLHEAKLNPRKHFDAEALKELAASITAKGVLTPLLVRPNAAGFEIAAGHRRYRAAKLAGVDEVPAIVREMTDTEFLEVLTIENLQREDVHPLEEAEGYRLLLDKGGCDVARISERVGKSVKYVYDRMKLLSLTKDAQQLFLEDKITAGHAILLARLKPDDQKRAIDPNERGAVFEAEDSLWDPAESDTRRAAKKADPYAGLKPVSVRELQGWIDQHVKFDRAVADPMLFPDTVGAIAAATEAAEKVAQITHSYYVQKEARDPKERIIGPRSWKSADKKSCEHAITGVIVVGPGRGEAFKICIAKEKCAKHWAAEQKEKVQRAKAAAKGGRSGEERWQIEQRKRKEQEARQEAERARWKKAAPAILEALAAAVKKAPTKATGLLAQIILGSIREYGEGVPDTVPLGKTAEDLVRHTAFRILAQEVRDDWRAPREFPKRAKAFGIDVKKIVDEMAPAPRPEAAA